MTSQFAVPGGLSEAATQRLGQYIQERIASERRSLAALEAFEVPLDPDYSQGRLDAFNDVRWILEQLYIHPVAQVEPDLEVA